MGKTIAQWKENIHNMSSRTLMEIELGLHTFLSVGSFEKEYGWTGLATIKGIIRNELNTRKIEWGELIFQLNPAYKTKESN